MRARSAASSRAERRRDRVAARLVQRAGPRRVRGPPHAVQQPAQLLDPLRHAVQLAPALQLRRGRRERCLELECGLAIAAVVEIEPGAQGEQLARERHVARGEQRGEPLLRPQRGLARDLRRLGRQLARHGPGALGDLVAGPVPDPRDERVARRDLAAIRIGCRHPAGMQRAVEHAECVVHGRLRRAPRRVAQPRIGLLLTIERVGADDGRARDLHRRGSGLGRARPAPAEAAAPRRVEPADDHHLLRLVARVAPHDVAAGIRSQPPRQLPLDEAEVRGRRYSPLWAGLARLPPACTAYLDGLRATAGLSISSSRSISLIHCFGLRIASTCFDAFAFAP